MAPIIKSTSRRRTVRQNVPPILTLRKLEPFDFLLNERHCTNPFLSSSETESASNSKKLSPCQEETSFDVSNNGGRFFFPERKSNEGYSPVFSYGKPKKHLSKVQKRRRPTKEAKADKSSTFIEYEKCITEYLKTSPKVRISQPLTSSTPLKQYQLKLLEKSPFSPILKNTDTKIKPLRPSAGKLSLMLSKLSFGEKQSEIYPSIYEPAQNVSTTLESFYGFPNVSSHLYNKRDINIIPECSDIEKNVGECGKTSSNDAQEVEIQLDHANVKLEMSTGDKGLNLDSDRLSKIEEECDKTDSSPVEISNFNSSQNENDKIDLIKNENDEKVRTDSICEEIVSIKQDVDEDYVSAAEEKEPDNEENSIESPGFEKENVILICEQSSVAEDDEDRSEDVSSALSSDQEAREGISSSDLESNSIDEEKDLSCVEIRRHSFEKISPRKSYIVGPFTRRRCLSMVSSVLSEGNESYVQTRDNDLSYTFQSNKHYVTCDNLNEQSPKSSLMYSDSIGDIGDEERGSIGGRSPPSSPALSAYTLYENSAPLDPLPENLEENQEESIISSTSNPKSRRSSEPSSRRRSNRLSKDLSPSRQSPISRPSVIPDLNMVIEESDNEEASLLGEISELDHFILPANKKYRRSLSIIRQLSKDELSASQSSIGVHKGRGYDQFVEQVIKLQSKGDTLKAAATPSRAYRKSLSARRLSLLGQRTPPRGRRASRISSLQSSPVGFSQHHLRRPVSLSATMLTSCNRTQLLASPLRFPSMLNQPSLLQNFSRYSRIQGTLKDTTLDEETEVKPSEEVIEGEGYTYKNNVMVLCEEKEPVDFSKILDDGSMEEAVKVGEGVYGEVFMIARPTRKNVLKIIPIEGDFLVNGEKQKTFEEIYTELIIAKWLDLLRNNDKEFMTVCFAELIASWIIKGRYPDKLLELWDEYDENKGSENDRPDVFNDEQLYLVLELGNAGTDLESYSFSTAKQALSIFKQTVFAIAVAEACFEFEHRDLHWGNVLISRTAERFISFRLEGDEYKVITNGVKSTIIDYTLSRITFKDNTPVYNDIGQDPDMFIATGDYQFDIYRHMKKDVCDRWEQFVPKTNVRWLHYLIDKIIKKVKYQRKTAKVHRDSMRCLQDIESWILNCDNSVAVALRIAEDK